MPRRKKHPNYNSEQIMNELLETVSMLYSSHLSVQKIGDELDLDWQKVRKLLCTASYRGMVEYDSEMADAVQDIYKKKKTVPEIMSLVGLSRSSVLSYLPYTKVPYKTAEVSANAERIRVFRAREQAVKELKGKPEKLWETVTLFQGYPFKTEEGQKFKYKINEDEMMIDQGRIKITKDTLEAAYRKSLETNGDIKRAVDEETPGGCYLYPILARLRKYESLMLNSRDYEK